MIWYLRLFLFNWIVEWAVAYALGFRKRDQMLMVFAVNAITHPILMLILIQIYQSHLYQIYILWLLECMVVMVEWRILDYVLLKQGKSKKYLLLSIAMNGVSYLSGVIIQHL